MTTDFARRAMLCAGIAVLGLSALAPGARAAGELTVAEVQAATGLAGVRSVAKGEVPGASGAQTFVDARGGLLLLVSFGDAKDYAEARAAFAERTEIAGLGDEAFQPTGLRSALYVRKGAHFVGLGSGLHQRTSVPILSPAQLATLAGLVVARL